VYRPRQGGCDTHRCAACCCSEQPTILEYIKVKHEVAELSKQAADWRRKIDIATMEQHRAGR
jgi:hypothetical protein